MVPNRATHRKLGKRFPTLFNPVQFWKSGENFMSSCGHTGTKLDIPMAGEVEEKEELKDYVMVDYTIVTCCKIRNI